MKVTWDRKALKDYQHFEQHAPKLAQRVRDLITAIKRSPHGGIGKPEPLRFDYAGFWSRRIDREHRLISTRPRATLCSSRRAAGTTGSDGHPVGLMAVREGTAVADNILHNHH